MIALADQKVVAFPRNSGGGTITLAALAELTPSVGYWYLASPYSNYAAGIDAAHRDVCVVAATLIKWSIPVFSPIAHSHPIAVFGGVDPFDHDIWLPADEPMMTAAHGMIIVKLPGWDTSRGIKAEIIAFRGAKKPIVYIEKDIAL